MITFTKIASYELRPKDRNVFEYLTDVASQVVDKDILEWIVARRRGFLYTPLTGVEGRLFIYI